MAKLAYLVRCIADQLTAERFRCLNCGSDKATIVDRKYIVSQLRRCDRCQIMFRTPTDDPARNQDYYEKEYHAGFTTDLPDDNQLAAIKRKWRTNPETSYAAYTGILTQLGFAAGAKVFDYGCSWGYGSYQLGEAGFDVTAFEVAPSRARYAREKLQVRTVESMDRAVTDHPQQFDCFFSTHVLEHVPSPSKSFAYAMQLLKPGGLFVAFMPNGSENNRAVDAGWSQRWGEVHPNVIDEKFLDLSFRHSPRAVGTSLVTNAAVPSEPGLLMLNSLDGDELLFIARKIAASW